VSLRNCCCEEWNVFLRLAGENSSSTPSLWNHGAMRSRPGGATSANDGIFFVQVWCNKVAMTQTKASYEWLPFSVATKYEAEAETLGVSEVARSNKGFMREYEKAGSWTSMQNRSLPAGVTGGKTWGQKRRNFIARFIKMYEKRKTRKIFLALLMWAYRPPGHSPPPHLRKSYGVKSLPRGVDSKKGSRRTLPTFADRKARLRGHGRGGSSRRRYLSRKRS
jgi:hypothetical protein